MTQAATAGEETREQFITRLKKEGSWDECHGWVRNAQKRIKGATPTLTYSEATAQAYELARSRWPSTGVNLSEEDIVHIAAAKGSMDVARDVEWAYEHLRDQQARADKAPSGGAWSMLQYAREARHKFLELVSKYDAQKQKKQDDDADTFQADAADHTKAIRKLRKITERVHADEIRDAIRQCPDVVVAEMEKAGYVVALPVSVSAGEISNEKIDVSHLVGEPYPYVKTAFPPLNTPDSEATGDAPRHFEGAD